MERIISSDNFSRDSNSDSKNQVLFDGRTLESLSAFDNFVCYFGLRKGRVSSQFCWTGTVTFASKRIRFFLVMPTKTHNLSFRIQNLFLFSRRIRPTLRQLFQERIVFSLQLQTNPHKIILNPNFPGSSRSKLHPLMKLLTVCPSSSSTLSFVWWFRFPFSMELEAGCFQFCFFLSSFLRGGIVALCVPLVSIQMHCQAQIVWFG